MVVAGMRAVYAELPSPIGGDPDPVARNLLPHRYLWPSQLAETVRVFPNAGKKLHHIYGSISAGMTYHVALRTRAIDDALRQGIAAGAKQIVLLGAGLDGRAFRLSELNGLRLFEVDHPNTQRDKESRLARATLRSYAELSFVPVDFEKDKLDESLLKAGFSRDVPSFWIWEGVTVYLTHEATASTLHAIARLSAPGSRLAMTYARPPSKSADPSRPLIYRGMRTLIHAGSVVLGRIGESVRGFLDAPMLNQMAHEAGFVIQSDENAVVWANRYWPGESSGPFEWERLALLERIPR